MRDESRNGAGSTAKNGAGPASHRLTISPTKAAALIVHRMPLMRFALSRLLEASARFVVCAQTDSAPEARELFGRHRPQLIVLGLTLNGGDGIGLIKDFHKSNPAGRCVVLTIREDALSVQRAFRAGASGYLVAHDDIAEILGTLEHVVDGELHASNKVCQALLENLACGIIKPVTSEMRALSDRQLQVLALIGRGFGVKRLAGELHLSVKTIETHQMRIKRKLGLRSAVELSEKASHWMVESTRRNVRLRIATAVGRSSATFN